MMLFKGLPEADDWSIGYFVLDLRYLNVMITFPGEITWSVTIHV